MADEEEEEGEEEAAPAGSSGAGKTILSIVLTAVVSGGAAFGGAYFGGGGMGGEDGPTAEEEVTPGATVEIKPFVLNVIDEQQAPHAMKITIAIELDKEGNADAFQVFLPRIRDSVLSYLRTLTYEEAKNPKRKERMQQDMLERVHRAGASNAKSVLIQDIVMQ